MQIQKIKPMKIFLFLVSFVIISIGIISCSSNSTIGGQINNNADIVAIDNPQVFITLNYKGKTITNYGLKSPNNDSIINNILKFYTYAKVEVGNDGNGNVKYRIFINTSKSVYPNVTNQLDLIAGGDIISNNPVGTYSISSSMFKDYTLLVPTQFGMYDGGPGEINITSIDQNFISGTFSFNENVDTDGVSKFPANGSFRLYRIY
jgi:hypothetical protein